MVIKQGKKPKYLIKLWNWLTSNMEYTRSKPYWTCGLDTYLLSLTLTKCQTPRFGNKKHNNLTNNQATTLYCNEKIVGINLVHPGEIHLSGFNSLGDIAF